MSALAIIGAGGHGKVVADIASQCGFSQIDFYDDGKLAGAEVGAWFVKGRVEELLQRQNDYKGIIVAIGNNNTRLTLSESVLSTKRITLIHPQAIVSELAQIGLGTVIMPGAVINAFAHVGDGVIVNTAAVIEHDCHVSDYCHISPGAVLAGNVTVGERSWLGANCSIKQETRVGASAVVGMGAVVLKDVESAATVVGMPAKERSK